MLRSLAFVRLDARFIPRNHCRVRTAVLRTAVSSRLRHLSGHRYGAEMVARYLGEDIARATAKHMEYPYPDSNARTDPPVSLTAAADGSQLASQSSVRQLNLRSKGVGSSDRDLRVGNRRTGSEIQARIVRVLCLFPFVSPFLFGCRRWRRGKVPGSTVMSRYFSPSPGTYAMAQSVALSTTTSGATIRYMTDGTMPNETVGTVYSGPFPFPRP